MSRSPTVSNSGLVTRPKQPDIVGEGDIRKVPTETFVEVIEK